MKMLDTIRQRWARARQRQRDKVAANPFANFTTRDWADLPPFHPDSDPDFPPR